MLCGHCNKLNFLNTEKICFRCKGEVYTNIAVICDNCSINSNICAVCLKKMNNSNVEKYKYSGCGACKR